MKQYIVRVWGVFPTADKVFTKKCKDSNIDPEGVFTHDSDQSGLTELPWVMFSVNPACWAVVKPLTGGK